MKLLFVAQDLGGSTGMGRVNEAILQAALDESYEVTVVTAAADPVWDTSATVVHLPRGRSSIALVEYAMWFRRARRAIPDAAYDLVHVNDPWLFDLADVMTCHHLAQAAFRCGVRGGGEGLARTFRRMQYFATRTVDHHQYRHRPPATRMTFVSEFLRDRFFDLYGTIEGAAVLIPPAPQAHPVTDAERAEIRRELRLPDGKLIVGYFGGNDPRKGMASVISLASSPSLHLLLAGPGSETARMGSSTGLGFVDTQRIMAACDVVVAPSRFDAGPLVAVDSLARGVPVVVSEHVGIASLVASTGAGTVWDGTSPLADAVSAAAQISADTCMRAVAARTSALLRDSLRTVYDASIAERG
jgi:glycosyltransferase involved in cell wall biosynthesis